MERKNSVSGWNIENHARFAVSTRIFLSMPCWCRSGMLRSRRISNPNGNSGLIALATFGRMRTLTAVPAGIATEVC